MMSAATGAMALAMAPLVREYGLDYLFSTTLLSGLFQSLCGVSNIARLMIFIPRCVMIGFVIALAILLLTAHFPHVIRISTMSYVFVGRTLIIVFVLARFMMGIRAPLSGII